MDFWVWPKTVVTRLKRYVFCLCNISVQKSNPLLFLFRDQSFILKCIQFSTTFLPKPDDTPLLAAKRTFESGTFHLLGWRCEEAGPPAEQVSGQPRPSRSLRVRGQEQSKAVQEAFVIFFKVLVTPLPPPQKLKPSSLSHQSDGASVPKKRSPKFPKGEKNKKQQRRLRSKFNPLSWRPSSWKTYWKLKLPRPPNPPDTPSPTGGRSPPGDQLTCSPASDFFNHQDPFSVQTTTPWPSWHPSETLLDLNSGFLSQWDVHDRRNSELRLLSFEWGGSGRTPSCSPMPGMMWNWSLTSLSTAVVMMRTFGKA